MRLKKDDLPENKEAEARLAEAAAFDAFGYFKRIATADVVAIHRTLLECFSANTPKANHHCLSYFRRLCTTEIPPEGAPEVPLL